MADPTPTPGIHHVTCVAGDPQRNLDFWVETLVLPGKFDAQREQIEAGLPDVTVPRAETVDAED